MKFSELKTKTAEELSTELIGLRREQFNLRMQRGAGQLANPMRFAAVRKDIARIKTILTERAGKKAEGKAEGKAEAKGNQGAKTKTDTKSKTGTDK